ncbi:MAG: DUF2069 domain-containing protein [Gammaproteobacteria bacterium]
MTPAQTARSLYVTMMAGYFGLLLWLTFWNTLIHPPDRPAAALLLIIAVAPLLLPLRGLLLGRLKSCAWTAYLSLPYFFHGVTELASEPLGKGTLFDAFEVALSLLLFFSGSFYIRYAAKASRP